jgi:hypothetical protein
LMNAGKAPPAVTGPIGRRANFESTSPLAAPLRRATRGSRACRGRPAVRAAAPPRRALQPALSRALLLAAEMLVKKRKRGPACAAGSGGMEQPDRPSEGGVKLPRLRERRSERSGPGGPPGARLWASASAGRCPNKDRSRVPAVTPGQASEALVAARHARPAGALFTYNIIPGLTPDGTGSALDRGWVAVPRGHSATARTGCHAGRGKAQTSQLPAPPSSRRPPPGVRRRG